MVACARGCTATDYFGATNRRWSKQDYLYYAKVSHRFPQVGHRIAHKHGFVVEQPETLQSYIDPMKTNTYKRLTERQIRNRLSKLSTDEQQIFLRFSEPLLHRESSVCLSALASCRQSIADALVTVKDLERYDGEEADKASPEFASAFQSPNLAADKLETMAPASK
ncbi:unnamed protein product [Dicrocoelium dendriticum]|nr:unnamed protein product [Dicrocoelium dendriticum]